MTLSYPSSRGIYLLCLFLVLVYLDFGNATSISEGTDETLSKSRKRSSENVILDTRDKNDCSIEGNVDLYGFGVRLGIYFQQLASYLANTLLAEEVSSTLAANSIYLFTILIAMFKGSVDGSLRVADGLILLQLCFSYFFSVLSLFGYRTVLYQLPDSNGRRRQHGVINGLGGFGTYFRLFLTAATSAYSVWFWFTGIDTLVQSYPGNQGTSNGPCASKVWVFTSLRIHGSIRWFMRLGSIACTAYFGGLTIIAFGTLALWVGATVWEFATGKWGKRLDGAKGFWIGMRREWRASKNFNQEYIRKPPLHSTNTSSASVAKSPRVIRRAQITLRILNLLVFIFGIVVIEFDLNVNKVKGVLGNAKNIYTPGQFIPLFIGAFGFARTIWLIFKEHMIKIGEKEDEIYMSRWGHDDNDSQGSARSSTEFVVPLTPIAPRSTAPILPGHGRRSDSTYHNNDNHHHGPGHKHGSEYQHAETDAHYQTNGSTTASSPTAPISMSDKLQAERNFVFAVVDDWLPWVFGLEFLQGVARRAASAHGASTEDDQGRYRVRRPISRKDTETGEASGSRNPRRQTEQHQRLQQTEQQGGDEENENEK